MRKNKSHNEHGVDCVTFFSLSSPHRWGTVQDFMRDKNGTIEYHPHQDDSQPPTFGGCGLRPDLAMMASEPVSRFDILADQMGWFGEERKEMERRELLLDKCRRINWLEEELVHSLNAGYGIPEGLNPTEFLWFNKELQKRRDGRKASRLRAQQYEQRMDAERLARKIAISNGEILNYNPF